MEASAERRAENAARDLDDRIDTITDEVIGGMTAKAESRAIVTDEHADYWDRLERDVKRMRADPNTKLIELGTPDRIFDEVIEDEERRRRTR